METPYLDELIRDRDFWAGNLARQRGYATPEFLAELRRQVTSHDANIAEIRATPEKRRKLGLS